MSDESERAEVEAVVGYKKREWPDHTCLGCRFSFVTNAGAIYPGRGCQKMDEEYAKRGVECGNRQVRDDAICNLHPALNTQVRPDADF